MSISIYSDEESTCIVCPKIKVNSPKDWPASLYENSEKHKVRKSKISFRGLFCKYSAKNTRYKVSNFADKELMMYDDYNFCPKFR
jgi:hypothetical protein